MPTASLPHPPELLSGLIPPVEELQRRLELNETEGDLLRRLLRLAIRREEEADRLVAKTDGPSPTT